MLLLHIILESRALESRHINQLAPSIPERNANWRSCGSWKIRHQRHLGVCGLRRSWREQRILVEKVFFLFELHQVIGALKARSWAVVVQIDGNLVFCRFPVHPTFRENCLEHLALADIHLTHHPPGAASFPDILLQLLGPPGPFCADTADISKAHIAPSSAQFVA